MAGGRPQFSRLSPRSSSAVRVSGDVNQGREMKVLARELDALDAAVVALERVGKRGRASHPERVGRVFEPLPVQGSELGRAEVLRGGQVAFVGGSGARFGQAFPFRK